MSTMEDMDVIVNRAIRCRFNVCFRSQPALGKTYRLTQIAAAMQEADPDAFFDVIDCGTLAPTDLTMAMPDLVERRIIRLFDERLPNALTHPNATGFIYWGEFGLSGLEVNRGLQKLIRHEDVGGGRRIPDGIVSVLDSNRLKDKSGVQQQSRAIMSDFEQIELEYSPDYALNVMKTYHERVAAFGIRNPQLIDNYADVFENDQRKPGDLAFEEGKQGIWASLRHWKRVSKILYDVDAGFPAMLPDELTRNVGSLVAPAFSAFCTMLDRLSTLEDIVQKPDKCPVPSRMDEQYALSTMLALLSKKDNFDAIATYMQRYASEIQVVYFRLLNDRLRKAKDTNAQSIRASKSYQRWITTPHIYKLITGTTEE